RGFVRSNSRRHLILEMQFPLLQTFLFELFLVRDLTLRRQLVEAILTAMMLFDPLPELGVFLRENLLNVCGAIRHRLSSFMVPVAQKRMRHVAQSRSESLHSCLMPRAACLMLDRVKF